jgi:predicted unusual protein kinase regulating ubiquinone biosynthesis (AarF/ABC1/UbiB family)
VSNFASEIDAARKHEAKHAKVKQARIEAAVKKAQLSREKSAKAAIDAASSTVELEVSEISELAEQISQEVRDELGAPPIHTVVFPRVCSQLVTDTVLVETWARGVTVASLFPQLDTRDAEELHRALAAKVANQEGTQKLTTSQWLV